MNDVRRGIAPCFVLTFALALGGCLKRVVDTVSIDARGGGRATLVATFDRDEVVRAQAKLGGAFAEALKAPVDEPSLLEDAVRTLETMRRGELGETPGVAIVRISYEQDAAAREVLERVELRFDAWEAWHRSHASRAPATLLRASLTRNEDGTWTYGRTLLLGGVNLAALFGRSLGADGPPKPAQPVRAELTLDVPGVVVEADPGARIAGSRVTWAFETRGEWRVEERVQRVRFRSAAALKPFRLEREDLLPSDPAAKGADVGPLDGDPGDTATSDPGTPRVVDPRGTAPAGTVPVTGRVTHRGLPMAGAVVKFDLREPDGSYHGGVAARTDADGRYRVPGLWPSTYGVQVLVGRSGSWLPDVVVSAGRGLVHDVALGAQEASVRVVGPRGEPIEGAMVWAHAEGHQLIPFGRAPRTDSQGTARVPFLSPGRHAFSATRDQAVSERVAVAISPEGPVPPVAIRLSGYGRVDVQVVDRAGGPVPGYVRYVVPDGGVPDISRATGLDGRISFYLSPGRWRVGLWTTRGVVPAAEERFRRFAPEIVVREGSVQTLRLERPVR